MGRHPEARERARICRKDPRLVPTDCGDRTQRGVGRERRGTNVGREAVSYDPVAPDVLQSPDAPNGDDRPKGKSCIRPNGTSILLRKSPEICPGQSGG